ncbi:MAG TPA: KEOPS complex subunit Cgi121 [Nitrososphaerales archaeon]|nr:KEOPS complex subunit Cgi121 [Nitrososphaerales archaeon]
MRVFTKAFLCPRGPSPDDYKRRLAEVNPGSMVQAAKGDLVGNEAFAELLAAQTLQAESSGGLLANKPEIDFLLRLAGTTQISKAIRTAGANSGDSFVLVVAARRKVRGAPGIGGKELPRVELTDSELGRIEKAALLNAEKA